MTTQRKRHSVWLRIVLTISLVVIALAVLHFVANSDVGAWIRSIHT